MKGAGHVSAFTLAVIVQLRILESSLWPSDSCYQLILGVAMCGSSPAGPQSRQVSSHWKLFFAPFHGGRKPSWPGPSRARAQ